MDSVLKDALSDYRRDLVALYGPRLREIILFGSHARGAAGPDSDVDVLVVLDGEFDPYEEIERTSEVTHRYLLERDLLISRKFATMDEIVQASSEFYRNVKKEGQRV